MQTEAETQKATEINPIELTDEEVVAGSLEWVNLMRSEHDLKPLDKLPRGTYYDVGDCALARALNDVSDGSCPFPAGQRYGGGPDGTDKGATWRYNREGKVVAVRAPAVIGEFITRFDQGKLDHLLA